MKRRVGSGIIPQAVDLTPRGVCLYFPPETRRQYPEGRMAVNFAEAYPQEINEETWKALLRTFDKNGKAAGKGAGTKIAAAEASWKLVKFDRLDARSAGKFKSPEEADQRKAEALQEKSGAVSRASAALVAAAAAVAAV